MNEEPLKTTKKGKKKKGKKKGKKGTGIEADAHAAAEPGPETPLHIAAREGDVSRTRELLEQGRLSDFTSALFKPKN